MCVCMCIYVCLCVCIYACICVSVPMCVCIFTWKTIINQCIFTEYELISKWNLYLSW